MEDNRLALSWRWMLVTAIAPVAWGSTYVVTRAVLPDEALWGAVIRALGTPGDDASSHHHH